ncbi:MAG: spermidine/putrescine ABC transporter substrate-binding protein [Candidatus Bipolaricaulota bacterium]|nr:spermidine/putrescine ABC transporter substrate-binding protein [Candidatus Bipolaricaulota bacterium]MCS7274701.1 spermidine/putrescine ABC transporter substrate-binding protein [Candidatus Bipolaricaulota bacterium]MDW8111584.1 spermidine/putrescine ABC transporter substrate-binding protein [Candidatus Bipolaricaulota bacterium]
MKICRGIARIFLILGLLGAAGCEGAKRPNELHLFIWANYINPEVYQLFEKEFGVKVIEENFDSNETLHSKLRAGVTGYDLITPSDYKVEALIQEGLLAELDLSKIPNFQNISARFKGLYYDPQNRYSIPYLWGTTGIGYHAARLPAPPTSWGDLFEPVRLQAYAQRISMLDDPREAIGAALKYLGYSLNSTNPQELEEAKNLLLTQKPYLARYDSETYDDFLLTGDLYIAHGWSGDFARARAENPEIRYVIPREGGVIWADNLAIPKSSKNKELAERFIDFLLRPEINAKIVNFLRYPSTNDAAKAYILPEILNDPGIYPPDEIVSKLEWLRDLDEANELYERVWTEVKSR